MMLTSSLRAPRSAGWPALARAGIASLALALAPLAFAAADDITVKVDKTDDSYAVSVSLTVQATQDQVWDVLTDFDHMAQILSNVDDSKIVDRKGNVFNVVQKSHGQAGPVRVSLNSTRRIELSPKTEIRSQFVSGDSLKSSVFTTRLTPQGSGTQVVVQGTFVPTWLAGSVITVEAVETQTRRQYAELRDEILRRKNGQPRPACLVNKTCQ